MGQPGNRWQNISMLKSDIVLLKFFVSPDLVIILRNVDWFSNTASIQLGSSGGFSMRDFLRMFRWRESCPLSRKDPECETAVLEHNVSLVFRESFQCKSDCVSRHSPEQFQAWLWSRQTRSTSYQLFVIRTPSDRRPVSALNKKANMPGFLFWTSIWEKRKLSD